MRAVPKAERHRLRELPTEELYLEWKLGLVMERLEPAGERYGTLEARCRELEQRLMQSREYWEDIVAGDGERSDSRRQTTQIRTGERQRTGKNCGS